MKLRITALLAALLLGLGGMAGCDSEGPAERAGEKLDEAMEETSERMKDAADEAEDVVDEAEDAFSQ